jgi:hypothetical protein
MKFKSSNITAVNVVITLKPLNQTDDLVSVSGLLTVDLHEYFVSSIGVAANFSLLNHEKSQDQRFYFLQTNHGTMAHNSQRTNKGSFFRLATC